MSRAATSRLKVNPPLGSPPTLEWRPITELGIDPDYQRSIMAGSSQALIRRIAQFWDWGLCQPLAIARRADGSLMVVDGQHRLEAARQRRDIPHLPCVITAYANAGDEAAAFVALNQQRRPLCKLDLFKAALAAEDEDSTAIASILAKCGLRLASHTNYTAWKPGELANIAGIQKYWRVHGRRVVEPSLRALALAFQDEVLRYAGTIFQGIAAFVLSTPDAAVGAEFDRLVRALKRRNQLGWRREILAEAATAGSRDVAAREVIARAFVREDSPSSRPAQIQAPPVDLAPLPPASTIWCQQCDQRVSGAKANACESPYCKAKAVAA